MNDVLTGDPSKNVCNCVTAVNPGRQRCQDKFSRTQILTVRGSWISSTDPISEMALNLRIRNGSATERQSLSPKSKTKIQYYLQDTPVCRRFFTKALAIDHRIVDQISALTRGKEVNVKPPSATPPSPRAEKDKQFDVCVAFWTYFFESCCQTPDLQIRLFPVNMSLFHIYNSRFWPWWKDTTGAFQGTEVAEEHLPPGDERLSREMNPHQKPQTLDPTSQDILSLFGGSDSDEELKHNPEQVQPSFRHLEDDEYIAESLSDQTFSSGSPSDEMEELWVKKALKVLQREKGFPSYSTFVRARNHKDFQDVQTRAEHFHCRCPTCATTMNRLMNVSFLSPDRQEYEKLMKSHHFEIKYWRTFETTMQYRSKSCAEDITLLSYDDTSALGLPRTTNRDIKNMPSSRVFLVPFNLTNHGVGETMYFYHLKDKWSKGADRILTILYHVIRRIKFKMVEKCSESEKLQRRSKRLVLMADNAAENKNNVLFQFCTELVLRKWYMSAELYFGPVGHTHNGNDAVHYIHNQINGNFDSATPAEFFNNFHYSWHSVTARPQPVIVETQFGWGERYKRLGADLGHFGRSRNQPDYVRAFRFQWSSDNTVECHVKGTPSDPKWYGENSIPDGPGFRCLKGLPPDAPLPIKTPEWTMNKKYINDICGPKFREYFLQLNKLDMYLQIVQIAKTGVIPSSGPLTPEEVLKFPHTKSMFGYSSVELIGLRDSHHCLVPFLREEPKEFYHESNFWKLPDDHTIDPTSAPVSLPDVTCPPVGYVKRKNVMRDTSPSTTTKKSSKLTKKTSDSLQEQKSKKSKRVQSSSSEDSDELYEFDGVSVPCKWSPNVSEFKVGSFAILETVYGPRGKSRGVSLVQVCSLHTSGVSDAGSLSGGRWRKLHLL